MTTAIKLKGENRYAVWCPACENPHVLDGWVFEGDLDTPTFRPSLLCRYTTDEGKIEFVCHSHIENGKIRYLDDCTHALKGQTVPLPDFHW